MTNCCHAPHRTGGKALSTRVYMLTPISSGQRVRLVGVNSVQSRVPFLTWLHIWLGNGYIHMYLGM